MNNNANWIGKWMLRAVFRERRSSGYSAGAGKWRDARNPTRRASVRVFVYALMASGCSSGDASGLHRSVGDSSGNLSTKAVASVAPGSVSMSGNGAAIPADLIAAREAVWRAYFSGDSAQLVALLPDTMIAMNETRAQIIANSQQFVRDGGKFLSINFTHDEFSANADMAVLYSRYQTRLDTRGKISTDSGQAIELFVKRDGKWINPSWHLHRVN